MTEKLQSQAFELGLLARGPLRSNGDTTDLPGMR